jgi:hypothetical protein
MPETYTRFRGNASEVYGQCEVPLPGFPVLPQVDQCHPRHKQAGSAFLGMTDVWQPRLCQTQEGVKILQALVGMAGPFKEAGFVGGHGCLLVGLLPGLGGGDMVLQTGLRLGQDLQEW